MKTFRQLIVLQLVLEKTRDLNVTRVVILGNECVVMIHNPAPVSESVSEAIISEKTLHESQSCY